jgi:hypothetical protein
MLLNEKPGIRKPKNQKPGSRPVLTLEMARARVSTRFQDELTGRLAKPKGVRGIGFRWAILDKTPETVEDLNRIEAKTAGPFVLDFDESERGKAFYITGRWENTTGEGGPWSEIQKVYIP